MPIYQLSEELLFPSPTLADESGVLAVGGDLRPERLLLAYANGIFPWPHEGMPLLWFSPDPRMVLRPGQLHVSRRLRRKMRQYPFELTLDRACREVIHGCAATKRKDTKGTWITPQMAEAYGQLHDLGFVHSVEVWRDSELVGGLYGVSIGRAFIGESMFTRVTDASKIAFVTLVKQLERWKFDIVDVQIYTDHLAQFGAEEWPRPLYLDVLDDAVRHPTRRARWRLEKELATPQ